MRTTNPKEKTMSELIERAAEVQKKAAQALLRRDELTFDECKELLKELGPCRSAVQDRVGLIRPQTKANRAGEVRARLLATATAEELQTLDAEFERLDVLRQQLNAQERALSDRAFAAELNQILENLPGMFQRLSEKTRAAAQANAHLTEALRDLQQCYFEVSMARSKYTTYVTEAPAVPPEVAKALFDLARDITRTPPRGLFESHAADVERTLGLRSVSHLGPQAAPDYTKVEAA